MKIKANRNVRIKAISKIHRIKKDEELPTDILGIPVKELKLLNESSAFKKVKK